MRRTLRSPVLAVAFLVAASRVGAQSSAPLTPEQPYHQTIAIDAIALPFGAFSGEFERALSPGFTFGLGGTYADFGDDERYRWFDAKLLYYPNENALEGFGVGLTAGYHSEQDRGDVLGFSDVKRKDSGATLGVVVDYNWLLGRRNRLLVGVGLGAKRVLKNVGDDSPLTQVLPSGRLSIGLAF